MLNLACFTKEASNSLYTAIADNEKNYYSSDPSWIAEYFSSHPVSTTSYINTSSIAVEEIDLVYSGATNAAKNRDDLENIKLLYGAYGNVLTPAQASNPLLWTTLCHTVPSFHEYILKRWRLSNGKVTIKDRFFATEARKSLCYENAISRLWWAGYLSYDKACEKNPWHLTETLLYAQQTLKDFTDQPLSMSRNVTQGLIQALSRMLEEKNGRLHTDVFRDCCNQYLNRYAAVAVIDVLEPSEIEQLAYKYMKAHPKA